MNYGKSNLSRRKKRISSKKRMKKKRVGVRLFKAFVLCILLLGIVGVAAGGVFVKHVIDNTPEVTAKDILPQGYTTSIVDQNGTVLEQLKILIPTVYTRNMTKFPSIWVMLLLPSR